MRHWKERNANPSLAIVGGGAAGFFLAINAKELMPELDVTIFEQQHKVLAKVAISGGGRCNCTNTFSDVTDLRQVYPRGATLLKRLFKQFSPQDAYRWFEDHGVPLTVQDDHCVFPQAQDSHAIIDCFLREARRHNIHLQLGTRITTPETLLQTFDFVALTTGGTKGDNLPQDDVLIPPVPSLFTFSIHDPALTALMGTVVENAIASIPATKFRTQGALLITHWGMSGPAILKLSSHAARHLAEQRYQAPLLINWTGESNAETVHRHLIYIIGETPNRLIDNIRPYGLQSRLWAYLLSKAGLLGKRCGDLGKKSINRLTDLLCNDTYHIASRSPYKDEFVTCGGISLDSINKQTLESKQHPRLFYAGEVLDIDGITGGFNFQAAWTTAFAVAQGIASQVEEG